MVYGFCIIVFLLIPVFSNGSVSQPNSIYQSDTRVEIPGESKRNHTRVEIPTLNNKKCCLKNTVLRTLNTPPSIRCPNTPGFLPDPINNNLDNLLFDCACAKGFYVSSCYECIPFKDCDKPCKFDTSVCKAPNEELIGCYNPLRANICPGLKKNISNQSLDIRLLYDTSNWTPEECLYKVCSCKNGFFKDRSGLCVKEEDCDKDKNITFSIPCSDTNEIRYGVLNKKDLRLCGGEIDGGSGLLQSTGVLPVYLSNLSASGPSETNDEYLFNYCDCKPNFKRNDCGICVQENECLHTKTCKCDNPCLHIPNSTYTLVNSCLLHTCYTVRNPQIKCFPNYKMDCKCNGNKIYNSKVECIDSQDCTDYDYFSTNYWMDANDIIKN